MPTVGTRAQVMHGTANKTSGGLTSKDLKYNSSGRIVSRKVSALAKQQQKLKKAGYTTVKGQFGAVKIGSKHMKGGGKFYMSLYTDDPRMYNKTAPILKEKFLGSAGPLDFSRLSSIHKKNYSIDVRQKEIAKHINDNVGIFIIANEINPVSITNNRIFKYSDTDLYIHLTENIPRNLVGPGNEHIFKINKIDNILKNSITSRQQYLNNKGKFLNISYKKLREQQGINKQMNVLTGHIGNNKL